MRNIIQIIESNMGGLGAVTDSELAQHALDFLARHAGVRPDYDPEWEDEDDKWTAPDSSMIYGAAMAMLAGMKPIKVNSSWGSGAYRGDGQSEHDAIVAEINRRA